MSGEPSLRSESWYWDRLIPDGTMAGGPMAYVAVRGTYEPVCSVQDPDDARLIAAAPGMLEALCEVVAVFDSCPGAIVDTVWCRGGAPETLRDKCAVVIEDATGLSFRGAEKHLIERDAVGAKGLLGSGEAELFKAEANTHELTEAVGSDGAENVASRAEDGYIHLLARRAVRVEVVFDQGGDFVVIGDRRYTFDELRLHGRLSVADARLLHDVRRYLQAVGVAP